MLFVRDMASLLPWPFSILSGSEPEKADNDKKGLQREKSVSKLLQHYEANGKPPPSARVDPKVKQQESQPFSIWDLWKYGAFAATKTKDIVGDVIAHQLWGPRRKSWGIEMTLLTSFMRNAGKHSQLVDIATIRMLMSIGGLAPLPSDALVTPVTFRVKKRKLRGILAEYDEAEDGTRELSGEWVVGKKLWKRLQAEWKLSRKKSSGSTSSEPDLNQPKRKERVILYLHGGAYYVFSAATHRLITIPLSKYSDARVFAIDYRLAPETRFPGPLHDAVSAYFRLIDDLHIPPENILIAGDSAGGGLTLALLMYLRDNNYPLPAAAICFSPWVDLTMSCESWDTNAEFDVVPRPNLGDHLDPVACYLGEHMERYLTHPYASPLFGDFKGLPPLLVTAGDAEVLRDEITLLAHKASLAGVEVRHELYEDAIHVFQMFPFFDATRKSFESCREFVRDVMQAHTPQFLDEAAEAELEQEIDNDKARMVRGDGLETSAPTHDVEKEKRDAEARAEAEARSSDEDPSWGPTKESPWPSPPATDEEDGSDTEAPGGKGRATTPSSGRGTPSKSRLRRIGSALSFLGEKAARNHHRTLSNRSHRDPTDDEENDHHQSSKFHVPHPHVRMSAFNITPSTVRPPKPSIRRSTSSHADISTLCKQWETSGPANRTVSFRHADGGPSGGRSKSKSFSLTGR
ncbi:alpha/beta-hydrolase [Gloeophyllum trabeum ATCC 11539]|uniref:Alpha/beta-hydrolase n=1 Tax=Gloeophyllum trabeum (strain ATCC 11539 / FP-39264 / Madison 617) TaxID=670483 RepID=S7QLJ3_GLOTA|nr:alpha/beta-hydrolase [Gloeophyllum trabeum ATCC 11539]EPQ60247.1 alpha/beta-hydrolase [Gloeophyllum trabeum ATCC 11539]